MVAKYLHQDLTEKIIGIAMEVHRTLGPGFLEAVYEEAFVYELEKTGLKCERQREFQIRYKEITLRKKLRCDLVIEDKIIIENKAASEISPVDEVQLVSYLKASGLQIGLLFNFGNKSLEFKRRIATQTKIDA